MLCALCLSIFRDGLSAISHSLLHIQKASEAGCKICSGLIAGTPRPWRPPRTTYSIDIRAVAADCFQLDIRRPAENDTSTINWFYLVKNESVQIPQEYPEFLRRARLDLLSEPWQVRPDGFQKPIPNSTGDPSVAKVALEWLESCLNSHGPCSPDLPDQHPTTHPKRLIKVGGSTSRLIVTEDEPPDGCYATLSHCWGNNPTFFTLTQSRLQSLKHELPLNDLPQTFRDAITLAWRLNIPYLWIDSLCILQDSKQDWLEHAQTMASIYEGCVLNISVDHASSACDGIFKPRDTSQVQESHVLWAAPGERETVWTVFDPDADTFYGRSTPLQRRAWVFQERLLAPRVLHFGTNALSWECKTNPCSCEASPKISQPWRRYTLQKVFSIIPDPPLHLTTESATEYHSELREQFKSLIGLYSQMELTNPDEDKLVAFSGIARRIGNTDYYNNQYFAGLFLTDFLVDLVWLNIGSKVTKTSQEIYRAPTWSWASLDSYVVTFPWKQQISDLVMLAEVRSISVSNVDPHNRYGQVKAAQLVLLGSLIPCRIGAITMRYQRFFRADLHDEAEPSELIGDFRPDMREGVSYEGRYFACPIVRDPSPGRGQIRGIVLRTTEDGVFYERLVFFASGPGWEGSPGEMDYIIGLVEKQVITVV